MPSSNLHTVVLKIIFHECVFYKSLYEKGFHSISDLLCSQGNFIAYETITNDFDVKLPFTMYEGLKHSILCTFPEVKHLDHSFITRPSKSEFIQILLKDKKGSRRIYDHFISKINHKPTCEKNGQWNFLFKTSSVGKICSKT